MAGKRKRIERRVIVGEPIEDLKEFRQNKCTPRARKIITIQEELRIELWYDQHYAITRFQHGEDTGEKREGINPEDVESLVKKAIVHLISYGSRVKGFHFLNHENKPTVRVVLQDSTNGEKLNVIIEAHLVDLRFYEVTVKTAMRKEDFKIENGGYAVDLTGENQSILKKQEGKNELEISILEL